MPPKKKTKEKGKEPEIAEVDDSDIFVDKEELLNEKLQKKQQLKVLSVRLTAESHEYMEYNDKKQLKIDSHITTLSKYNGSQINQLQDQEDNCMKNYTDRRKVLEDLLKERNRELNEKQDILEGFGVVICKKQELTKEMHELERDIRKTRSDSSSELSKLKKYLEIERNVYENVSKQRINAVARNAYEEGIGLLSKETVLKMKANSRMRRELQSIMEEIKVTNLRIKNLEKQNENLIKSCIISRAACRMEEDKRKKLVTLITEPQQINVFLS
ncbi:hypothetical protein Ciccas_000672 [Cichlidogyrus casuarinus]|uniref:Uncharacterized protein n=1 Tax=Cichlidogyrus casuarinus TaxID=1844966 RepID=A0ABD2QM69_9PLAT